MKSKWTILGLTLVAVVAVGGGAAYAHGRFGHGGFMKAMMEKRIAEAEDYVEATPEQRKVIDAARDSIETKMKAHFEAHRAAMQANQGTPRGDPHDMVRLLAQDNLDEQAIYAEIDRRAEEMKAMARELVPEIKRAHDVLTPAQRQKLAARATERRANMKQHWEERHGEQGGFGGPASERE